jgi:uncharacterized LabA/DUF88 family protein
MEKLRTYIYIDGFNLYYRTVKDTPYKWLDFKKLLSLLLSPRNEILIIKYFTALVSGEQDPGKPLRQQTYLRAVEKYIPELRIYFGHFLSHPVFLPLANSQPIQFAKVKKMEEKGSDVNLAVHLLNDAWLDVYDCAVIISNDSDLAEALRLVKKQTDKKIGILTPVDRPSKELLRHADFIKRIRKGALAHSQLPNPIPGTKIFKPDIW